MGNALQMHRSYVMFLTDATFCKNGQAAGAQSCKTEGSTQLFKAHIWQEAHVPVPRPALPAPSPERHHI